MKRFTVAFIMVLCFFTGVKAQDASFTLEVSTDTVLLGNYFELKYTIENAEGRFEAPDLSAFQIVGGPNTSTRMSIINGKLRRSSSYSFYLQPRDVGNFTIPPAFVHSDDQVLETVPLEIIVIPNPDGIVQYPNRPGRKIEDFLEEKTDTKARDTLPSRPRKRF